MPRITSHQEQQGFLTIAQNTNTVDYLQLAYLQALSIKTVMPSSRYAVLVDAATAQQVSDQHRTVFDYVIEFPKDYATNKNWKLSNEWQVFNLTPFKETVKLESDVLFTRSIAHWWTAFRLKDVVLSNGCKNYLGDAAHSRLYRKVFDDNALPDTYNGLMYFRYSKTAAEFFNIARQIYQNWETVRTTLLKNCRDPDPTTDVVYSLTAKIIGIEKCTIPSMDYINFVHMKSAINNWPAGNWTDMVLHETDLPMLRIANVNQYHPVHYYEKTFASQELVKKYERQISR